MAPTSWPLTTVENRGDDSLGKTGTKRSGQHMSLLHHRYFIVFLLPSFHPAFYYVKISFLFLILIQRETIIQST